MDDRFDDPWWIIDERWWSNSNDPWAMISNEHRWWWHFETIDDDRCKWSTRIVYNIIYYDNQQNAVCRNCVAWLLSSQTVIENNRFRPLICYLNDIKNNPYNCTHLLLSNRLTPPVLLGADEDHQQEEKRCFKHVFYRFLRNQNYRLK